MYVKLDSCVMCHKGEPRMNIRGLVGIVNDTLDNIEKQIKDHAAAMSSLGPVLYGNCPFVAIEEFYNSGDFDGCKMERRASVKTYMLNYPQINLLLSLYARFDPEPREALKRWDRRIDAAFHACEAKEAGLQLEEV